MAEEFHEKQRIIQEFVPGKQVTLAHVISNPDESLYKKMGVIGETSGALGIMTITPSEGAIIGADVASKAALWSSTETLRASKRQSGTFCAC